MFSTTSSPRRRRRRCNWRAVRTITNLALHQHDAETILRRLSEIEAVQRDRHRD
jgi:hypothetical protein